MELSELLQIVGDEPVFKTGLLLAGNVKPADVRKQLSRWTASGRIYQLRRGLYTLAPPFQKIKPHPFVIANRMVIGSYVSCQSALAHYGLIPEHVANVLSVTAARPVTWDTPLGRYEFRHVKSSLFFGYQLIELGNGQRAFIAKPEKALLDLIYLQPHGDSIDYLHELRLQNLDRLDLTELERLTNQTNRAKLRRAARHVIQLARAEAAEYESI